MNKHLPHLEDLILLEGEPGYEKAIRVLSAFAAKELNYFSIKYDGAPAVFFGTDPNDDRFFVSTKSIFNKTPIVFKDHDYIDSYIKNDDLKEKLKLCLDNLPRVEGVIQADLLFDHKNLIEYHKNDRQDFVRFHPNTIGYHVNVESDITNKIPLARLGIVPHTYYVINNQLQLTMIEENIDVKYEQNVYVFDSQVKLLNNLKLPKISIKKPKHFKSYLTSDLNKFIRSGEEIPIEDDTIKCYVDIMNAKDKLIAHYDRFDSSNLIVKKYLINKDDRKMIETGHEGYVYKNGTEIVKLVNRRRFSHANFSGDFLKGWNYK